MIYLSLISFLQMFILPGTFLFLIVSPKKIRLFLSLAIIVALSAICNYFLVVLLILLKIYIPLSLYIIMCIEVIGIAVLLKIRKFQIEKLNINTDIFSKVAVLLSCLIILSYFYNILTTYPKIFSSWDDVVSWNRWASVFYSGKIPEDTQHYPQCLTALWSISYVLYGNVIEFLPKATVPIFIYLTCICLIEEGGFEKIFSSVVAGILIMYSFYKTGYVHSGYMDIPVSAIAFLSIIIFNLAEIRRSKKLLLLSSVIAISSGLIKQAGIFVAIILYIMILLFYRFETKKEMFKFVLFYFFAFIFILGSFYIYTELNILRGKNGSEIPYVTNGIYKGIPFYKRIFPALKSFFKDNIILLVFLPFIFLQKNKKNIFIGIFGIAYLLIWSAFYSYDRRNGFLSYPFIIYSGCHGIEFFVKTYNLQIKNFFVLCKKYIIKNKTLVISIVGLIFITLLVLVNRKMTMDFFITKQNNQKLERGGNLGKFINLYYSDNQEESLYLSNFQPLGWTADGSYTKSKYQSYFFDNVEDFKLKLMTGEFDYFCLAAGDANEEIISYVNKKIQEKVFVVLYGIDFPYFIKVVNKDAL